jgi:serine/threonine-protein kinase RsbW
MVASSSPTGQHTLRFPATLDGFTSASEWLRRLLDDERVDGRPRRNVELAFEEIGMNIIRHGRPRSDVEVTLLFGGDEVLLTFEDDGIAFDPLAHPDPDVPATLERAKIGGLGVFLVKKLAARFEYDRTPQQRNRVTIAIAAAP